MVASETSNPPRQLENRKEGLLPGGYCVIRNNSQILMAPNQDGVTRVCFANMMNPMFPPATRWTSLW